MTTETEAAMTQEWTQRNTKESVETSVKLTNAPDITWRRVPKKGRPHNVTGRPYNIRFSFTRYDHGPWLPSITIYAQRPGMIVGDFFRPDQLVDVPQWLTDLIANATPAE